MKLVLAEKPSVARDMARVLGCKKTGNGCIEGKEYVVTWALGHLVTLKQPEMYDSKYKSWRLEDLPMLPKNLETTIIRKTGKQFNAVKQQLLRKDIDEVIIATDAGREGELVARWILKQVRRKFPVKRLWISSVTDKAIREGFKNLKPSKHYDALYEAAVARSEADWYVGLNATRALTTKHNASLNCGRVQTPTLKMIYDRSEAIKSFKPKKFYGLKVHTPKITFDWIHNDNQKTVFNTNNIKQAKSNFTNEVKITNVSSQRKKSYPSHLYDLTTLQRDANQLYGFSAKETLNIMQSLYERHKVVTYPRTDAKHISSDMVDTLKERVKAVAIRDYRSVGTKILQKGIITNKAFVDDSKVSDHHAIIPTEKSVIWNDLSQKEARIYHLIVKRFLSMLLPPFEYESITITALLGNETLKANGQKTITKGFKLLNDENTSNELPTVYEGDTFKVTRVEETNGETSPPQLFTEATLLQAMENPSKYSDINTRDAKTLKNTGGLGTVATRADIIEKLFNSFLIERHNQHIKITSKGRQLLDLAPKALTSPVTTATWENKLELIAKGKLKRSVFIEEIKNYTKEMVIDVKNSTQKFKHDNISGKDCPDCGKPLLEVNGKNGKMLVCQDRNCGHKKNVSKTTNARCPQCKKKLTLVGEGDGQMFTCKCGYREKLSTFKARKDKEKRGKVDRRTVKKYMKQDDEPLNNQLAEQLKGLKFD